MIEIRKEKKSKTNKVNEPYYLLKYYYMIGDADGNTSEKVEVSLNNPFVERYVTLLNSLKPTKGHWGVMLEEDRICDAFKENQITEDDYRFLCRMMFEELYEEIEEFEVSPENEDYANEFYDGVRSDTEYSFLVFEGVELFYVDEFGKKHKTTIK